MKATKTTVRNVDEYIASFPEETQQALQLIRRTIKKAAPEAEEVISYQMPAYKLSGMLVYFAGYAQHVGFYPTPSGIENFKKELLAFKSSKGAVQFPLNQPLPTELITRIVTFRVKENLEAAQARKKREKL